MLWTLLRWFVFYMLILLLLLVGFLRLCVEHPAAPAPEPDGHRLLHHWVTQRGSYWVRDVPFWDKDGNYLYKDPRANLIVLALLGTTQDGVLARGVEDATDNCAVLFSGTPYAMKIESRWNEAIVICPDLAMVRFELEPGDARGIIAYVRNCMQRSSRGSFCLVQVLSQWAHDNSRVALARYLDDYDSNHAAPQTNRQ